VWHKYFLHELGNWLIKLLTGLDRLVGQPRSENHSNDTENFQQSSCSYNAYIVQPVANKLPTDSDRDGQMVNDDRNFRWPDNHVDDDGNFSVRQSQQ